MNRRLQESLVGRRHESEENATLAAGAVFLSYCQCVRATGYGLARPSISEWVDIWLIEGLLTQKVYRNGCILTLTPSPQAEWTLSN